MKMQGSVLKKALYAALGGAAMLSLAACGQDPSFLENQSSSGKKSADQKVDNSGGQTDDNGVVVGSNGGTGGPEGQPNGSNNNGGTATVGTSGSDEEAMLPGGGQNDWTPDWADGEMNNNDPANPGSDGGSNPANSGNNGGTTTGATPPADPNKPIIPGAGDNDLDALHKCLAKWKDSPFKGTVYNYRKISASVSVGGVGNLINDTENTTQPFLTLVEAGVNVFGAPTYNLMNRNGYYCIKVNVNVSTSLSINLHCNARLADQKVNVNVGSTQNDTTSAVGVHVLSNVQVNTVRPEGDSCIR